MLFLCTHNAGRSQMALGFFTHLARDNGVAWSGGSEPGNEINPAAIEAMAEVGIDITREFPKPWTDEIVQAADVVVTMGCGDACPIFPGKNGQASPHPMVTTTSAAWTISSVHGLGNSRVMSMPTSAIAAAADGLISLPGSDPPDQATPWSPARWLKYPRAI